MSELAVARSDAHYEALRRAYDERVKSLSRKLRGGSAGGTAAGVVVSAESNTMISSSPGDESESMDHDIRMAPGSTVSTAHPPSASDFDKVREEQIDTLVEKMSALSTRERDTSRSNVELKTQLDKTSQTLEEKRKEQQKLQAQLADMERTSRADRDYFETTRAEEQKELERFRQRCHSLEAENKTLREENAEFEKRLEALYDERQNIQQEVISFTKQQDSIQEELKQSQELLRQSELERASLRDQYVHVGEKFERLMDLEEKENGDTLRELNVRLKGLKTEKEKHKKKTDRIIVDLEEALKTKEVECDRLQALVDEERSRHQESEQTLLETQRKTLHEHNLGLAKLSEMMPIASHQQILEETRRHHHAGMLELEQNLRGQYQKQLSEQSEQEERKQKEFQDTLLHVRTGLKKLEAQRDDASRKAKTSDEESVSLRQQLRRVTTEAKDLEESKKLFAQNLEEANSNLVRLRQMWEEEKSNRLSAEKTNTELKRKLAVKDEFLKKERGVLMEDLERTIGSKLRWAEDETERLLSKTQSADQETDRLRAALAAKDAKIIQMLDDRSDLERKFARDQAVGRKAVELLVNCQQTTKLFCDAARRELAFLKKSVQEEVQTVFHDVLSTRCASLQQMLKQQDRQSEKTRLSLKREIADQSEKTLSQKQQYQDILAQQRAVNKQFEFVTKERDEFKRKLDAAKDKHQEQELLLERILSAVVAPLPALDQNKEALLLASTSGTSKTEVSEQIKSFRAKIAATIDDIRKGALQDHEKTTNFKLKAMEEKLAHELGFQKESEMKAKTDHERQLAEYALQMAEMRGTVATLEDRHREIVAKNNSLEAELKEAETDLKFYASRCEEQSEELERRREREDETTRETELLVELAKTEAVQPVKEQMREVFQEAERLQNRFAKDLHDRDQQWESMVEQIRQDSNQLLGQREKEYQAANAKLERELERGREREQELVAEVAKAKHEVTLRQSSMMSEIDRAATAQKRAEHECEQVRREMKNVQEASSRQHRTMQEALDLKTRLAEEIQRENRQLVADRDEEIRKITELKEDELERLQSTIKNQYAQPRTVSQVVTQQEQLEKEAESLSMRVKQHLASPDHDDGPAGGRG
ncbi:unnamed protein product [Amoebophrya sp. A120]|nr:unnamed protein product [Amoebophrya sp. A120]|eukprot:GSA120T00001383001.1